MHRIQFLRFLKSIFFFLILFCGHTFLPAQVSGQIIVNDDIQIIHLKDSVFVHVSWFDDSSFGRFPSNGMLIIKNGEAIIIDTPMDNVLTSQLVNFIEDSLHVAIKQLIIGHFHDDCMGGLNYIESRNIPSLANWMTIEKCRELDLPLPSESFRDKLIFNFNGLTVECRYFGGGHSFDNITVYLPAYNILFGGCLIKSLNAQNLGNLADARVDQWPATVSAVMREYPDVEIVVPGHGNSDSPKMLSHTLDLLDNFLNNDR